MHGKKAKYTFEIYLLQDAITREQWDKLHKTITKYLGFLETYEIQMRVTDNVVRYFISSAKDLGALSSNLESIVLHPVSADELILPDSRKRENGVHFVTGGNLLDLREKQSVKKSKKMLEVGYFKVRSLNSKNLHVSSRFYFRTGEAWTFSTRHMFIFPSNLLNVDFRTSPKYLKKPIPKYLNIEKSMSLLSGKSPVNIFEVDGFPYLSQQAFISLGSYEFDKHSLVVGASGSGKSKLLSLIVDRLASSQLRLNYRVVIIDPHASIADDLGHISDTKIINFNQETAALFEDTPHDVQAATELTTVLFKSLIGDQFNARLERVLRYSIFVLITAQNMSLDTLKRFLIEVDYRNQLGNHVRGYIPDNIIHFFGTEFNELKTQHYNEAILPIISLIDELQLQPSLTSDQGVSLESVVKDNFLTVFSLNKVSMGEKVVKTTAGLIIQQLFLLAQAKAFNEKIILIVDEVSVIQNPAIAQILAEARKFNLTIILAQQYFGQIEEKLQQAVFANVFNYYVFKVSEEDARLLEGNMSIELPKSIIKAEKDKGNGEREVRVKLLTGLSPRECLVRLAANGQVLPCMKARTVDTLFSDFSSDTTQKLKPYKEARLPGKFVEKKEHAQKLAKPILNLSQERQVGEGLRSLLSQHSSSRFLVRKRKDTE